MMMMMMMIIMTMMMMQKDLSRPWDRQHSFRWGHPALHPRSPASCGAAAHRQCGHRARAGDVEHRCRCDHEHRQPKPHRACAPWGRTSQPPLACRQSRRRTSHRHKRKRRRAGADRQSAAHNDGEHEFRRNDLQSRGGHSCCFCMCPHAGLASSPRHCAEDALRDADGGNGQRHRAAKQAGKHRRRHESR